MVCTAGFRRFVLPGAAAGAACEFFLSGGEFSAILNMQEYSENNRKEVGIMYKVGDKIVHPMHGAGVIDSIVSRKVNGVRRDYYQLRLPADSMQVMIPTDHTDEIGVRPVMGPGEAAQVMAALCSIQVDMSQNWNRRYRENMVRLKSGDLLEVARVVKGLMLRDGERGLSTGERKMLHSARQILLSELVLAQDLSYQCASERLDEALA